MSRPVQLCKRSTGLAQPRSYRCAWRTTLPYPPDRRREAQVRAHAGTLTLLPPPSPPSPLPFAPYLPLPHPLPSFSAPCRRRSKIQDCLDVQVVQESSGTWCSGITSASHAEGPGFKSQCVHDVWQRCAFTWPTKWPRGTMDQGRLHVPTLSLQTPYRSRKSIRFQGKFEARKPGQRPGRAKNGKNTHSRRRCAGLSLLDLLFFAPKR